jgi:TPP-dependent pyruvate/acetoin dehydrogenase alpha subunit
MQIPIDTEHRRQQPKLDIDAANAASRYPESTPNSSPSDPEVLRRLYSKMLACRMLRERARGLLKKNQAAASGFESEGSEAIDVGATFELRAGDALSLYHRDLVPHVLKGRSLRQVFAQILGKGKHQKAQNEHSPFVTSNIVPPVRSAAAQFNLAAGVAFACKQRGQRDVVLAIFGEGFDALGSWHDAAKLAGEHRLPIIFVVESDRARYMRTDHWFGVPGDLSDRARDYDFPGVPVDGEDVVAVFRVAQESIHRARNGAGPTLIECKTSRLSSTSTPSAANGFRHKRAQMIDPLAHMEHYLRKRKAWSSAWKEELVQRLSAEMKEAVAQATR